MANSDVTTLDPVAPMQTTFPPDVLCERWSGRINVVNKVFESKNLPTLSKEKQVVLAQCLENTQEYLNSMTEATDAGDTAGFKHYALDLVTSIVPNLVAHEIVSVQPIDNIVGTINYIRYLYGSSKGRVTAGQEFASGILYRGSDAYYSSSQITDEGLTFTAGGSDTGKIEGTLAWRPIIKGSIRVPFQYKDGGESKIGFAVDTDKDGNLKFVDSEGQAIDGAATGTIDYESGKIEINATKEFEANDMTGANYRYDNLSIGDGAIGTNALHVPEVELRMETMPVKCQSRKLQALYAFDAAYVLRKEYGQDIDVLLNSQISAEIAHEIDGEIMGDLLVQAGLTNDTWDRSRPEGISLADHYQSFRVTLLRGSNKIFGATKRANANFLICGLGVATVIESLPGFTPSGITANIVGPHVAGTLGNLMVVKNPYYPDDSYVLGYRGTSLFDAGYFYCPYMPITTTQNIMLNDFVGRRGWATMYAKKMVQPLLYCRGEITALDETTE